MAGEGHRGDVLDGRWRILALAGRGASGEVYRAVDLVDGRAVALKRLAWRSHEVGAAGDGADGGDGDGDGGRGRGETRRRFARECAVLASLDAPHVVRHLGHGESDGVPHLVMEWLEGETLAARLGRTRLGPDEALALARGVARALAALHAAGVVHRDLKPSNLFLPGGDVAAVKLIDFGLARRCDDGLLTTSGAVLGTPAYMAPEQARGHPADARADVFALGAVLYEGLAGRPRIACGDVVATLAALLVDDVPPLEAVASDCPRWLATLVARLLAREPHTRPADGAAVLALIADRATLADEARTPLSRDERNVLSVVWLGAAPPAPGDATVDMPARAGVTTELVCDYAERHGGRVEVLPGGETLIAFGRSGAAVDRAERADRCAHALHAETGRAVTVATGLGLMTSALTLGEVVERARAIALHNRGIARDDATERLLAARRRSGDGSGDEAPFVGRRAQIAALETLLGEANEERCARYTIVSAEPGAGKTRLAERWLERDDVAIWRVRGEQAHVAVALGSLAALVADALGERREGVPAPLRELLPSPNDTRAPRAAAPDPGVAVERRMAALADLVRGAARERALVVLVDDAQWIDTSTLRALADLSELEAPVVWLFTARDEGVARIADVLGARLSLHLRLPPLAPGVSAELVRALRPDAAPEIVAQLAHKGAGNPLFLEELARATRPLDETPATVRMMLQARLELLHPIARRVLRAASVFGRESALAGVAEVADIAPEIVRAQIAALVRDDLVRRGDDDAIAFRHDLVRESAYTMHTEADRKLAHRHVAAWLAAHGERAATIAQHLMSGERGAEAAAWWARAVEEAHRAGDHGGVERAAAEARALGVDGDALGRVEVAESWTHMVHGRGGLCAEIASAALDHLEPHGDAWYEAAANIGSSAVYAGRTDLARAAGERLLARWPRDGAAPDARLVQAGARVGSSLVAAGVGAHVGLVERIAALDPTSAGTRGVSMLIEQVRGFVFSERGDHAAAAASFVRASAEMLAAGWLHWVPQRCNAIDELVKVGAWARAEAVALEVIERADTAKLRLGIEQFYAVALAYLGRFDEALPMVERALAAWDLPFVRGSVRSRVAWALMDHGRLDEALAQSDAALAQMGERVPSKVPAALATRSLVRRARGELAAARADAEAAWAGLEALGSLARRAAVVRLAYARHLEAEGDGARAAEVLAASCAALRVAAERISDDALARSFLEVVPEHAATFAAAACSRHGAGAGTDRAVAPTPGTGTESTGS